MHLQFHAGREELLTILLPKWLNGIDFYTEASDYERILLVDWAHLGSLEGLLEIWISLGPISLVTREGHACKPDEERRAIMRDNGSLMYVQPGYVSATGLRESIIGAVSSDPAHTKIWKRVVQRARRSLMAGAIVRSPVTNASAVYPSHRFSAGALRLQKSGIQMVGAMNAPLFELLEPSAGNATV